MSERILNGVFLFEKIYDLFGTDVDSQIITRMSTITVCSTIVVLIIGYFKPAPYGRYLTQTTLAVNAKLSWMIQEAPAIFVPVYLLLKSPCLQMSNLSNQLAISLFMIHYFQRTFIYPFRVSSQARPVPLWTLISAFGFCLWNGFYQGHHLINVSPISNNNFAIPGAVIFITGLITNFYHDQILVQLSASRQRREDQEPSTSTSSDEEPSHSYKIPHGGLFTYVSGANYLGEIMEWWGLALLTRQFPQVMFALFSTQFLGQRALHHHDYYKKLFGEVYPKDRKAIIPFIL